MMMRASLAVLLAIATPVAAQRGYQATVVTAFGGAMDNPADELVGVTSAIRTPSGQYVVGNSKPVEVRVYAADGRTFRRLGGSGEGPGQFKGGAYVFQWQGDSVLTLSTGTNRWMLFGLDGKLIREWPRETTTSVSGISLVGAAFVRNIFHNQVNCVSDLIRRLAPATANLPREAMVDESGSVWMRTGKTDSWLVYDQGGRALTTVTLPARFWGTQVTGRSVTGVQLDEDDFPHVISLSVPAAAVLAPARPRRDCAEPPRLTTPVESAMLRTDMRNGLTAAQAFVKTHERFPTSMDDLDLRLSSKNIGKVLAATGSGFAMQVQIPNNPWRCVTAIGDAIPGWPPNTIACGN
jgi:hypothetical protein